MALPPDSLSNDVIIMLDKGQGIEEIEDLLLQRGLDDQFVKELVTESVKLRDAKKRLAGLTLILIGACICFLSFLLTITSSFSHGTFGLVLYGLTSVGILVVFAGFTKIF